MNVTINAEQRLFVIPCGEGYTTNGFDYVYKQLRTLSERLGVKGIDVGVVDPAEVGTMQQYEQYRAAFGKVGTLDLGTWFDPDTPKKVRSILESYRRSGGTLRLFYGDRKAGRDWMQEYDMVGRIGRSTGVMKIPLLVSAGDDGGFGILDGCVVRIIDAETMKEVYRHRKYHQPELTIQPATCGAGYTYSACVDGAVHANFRSVGKAAQWIAFMTGESIHQPE